MTKEKCVHIAVKPKLTRDHMFSVQLKSKDYLKLLILPKDEEDNILIEGFLGIIDNVSFTEDIMIEINGANGSLKMDLTKQELKRLLPKK